MDAQALEYAQQRAAKLMGELLQEFELRLRRRAGHLRGYGHDEIVADALSEVADMLTDSVKEIDRRHAPQED